MDSKRKSNGSAGADEMERALKRRKVLSVSNICLLLYSLQSMRGGLQCDAPQTLCDVLAMGSGRRPHRDDAPWILASSRRTTTRRKADSEPRTTSIFPREKAARRPLSMASSSWKRSGRPKTKGKPLFLALQYSSFALHHDHPFLQPRLRVGTRI